MIGKLTGRLDDTEDGQIILDVGGVGYLIFISLKTRHSLPGRGEALSLYIETHMREDALRLYGFFSRAEQEWFRLLQNVQGVGAKLALAILGSLTPAELSRAIAGRDTAAICRAPGAGKKLAERLINELKTKLPASAAEFAAAPSSAAGHALSADLPDAAADASSALSNLGYKGEEAGRAIAQAMQSAQAAETELNTAELIRLGLQFLAKK